MKSKKFFQWVRILLFSAALAGACMLGFIISLRPAVSDTEGRVLTKFPTFTWESFLSGEYTSQISLWYADTYPFRDKLLDWDGELKGLYGVGSHDFSGYEGEVDTIGPDNDFDWGTPIEPDTEADTTPQTPPSDPTVETEPETEPETGPETGASSESIDGYYVEEGICWQDF